MRLYIKEHTDKNIKERTNKNVKESSHTKTRITAIFLASAAAMSGLLFSLSSCKGQEVLAAGNSTTATAEYGDLVLGLSADGKVALPVTPHNFEVGGILKKLHVSTGQTVKAGDLLAELDDSDYQLAIKDAQNALDKAEANYETAVKNRDYSLKNSEKSLDSLRSEVDKPFDEYSYKTAISDAETSLERKETALADAEEAAKDPFDPYSYDNNIKDAKTNIDKKQAELNALTSTFDDYTYKNQIADAAAKVEKAKEDLEKAKAADTYDDYSQQNTIKESKITLDKRKTELADAEKTLTEAKAKTYDPYDSKTIDQTIYKALVEYNRKVADGNLAADKFNKAGDALTKVKAELPYNPEGIKAAEDALEAAMKVFTSAENATQDAKITYDKAVQDKADAIEAYDKKNEEDRQKLIDDANTKIKSAQTAVSDAQRSYDKTVTDLERAKTTFADDYKTKVESAEKTLEDAEKAYDKALADLDRAISSSDKDLADKIKTAKDAVTTAKASYEKAVADKARAYESAVEDADKKAEDAKTAVADAKLSLEKAKTNLTRARKDYNDSINTKKENLEMQEISYDNDKESTQAINDAKYNIDSAQLKLDEAVRNLEKAKLYATAAGQVISISTNEGQQVNAKVGGAEMMFGTSGTSGLVTICDITQIYLTSSISEGDIVGIKQDQVVNVTIDSIGDTVFKGKVYSISNIPTSDSNGITTYSVTVKLDDLSTDIKDGMNALMNFVKKEMTNVLMIPVKAVYIEDGKQYADVQKADGTTEKRQVSTGFSNGTQTEVVSGLTEGDIVVIPSKKKA